MSVKVARGVEEPRGPSADSGGDNGGSCLLCQPTSGVLPLALDEVAALVPAEAHLACGERDQDAAPAEPEVGSAQPCAASRLGERTAERVDEEAGRLELRNAVEHVIG